MPDTKMPNGTSLYYYTNDVKQQNYNAAIKGDRPRLSRQQRRKLERKLRKSVGKNIKLEVD